MGKSVLLLLLVFAFYCTDLSLGHASCGCGARDHDHDHDHDYDGVDHPHPHDEVVLKAKIPEELAEDEEMELYGFGHHHHEEEEIETNLSGFGLWMSAMGCSLLVSLASLVCLILLPFIFIHGKPSKAFVDSLALFGAGAMLGDAFLHQLPHAFGGSHSHSHDHHDEHSHSNEHSHSHSLKDLSVGLSILAGIVLFLLVEKLVRYIEHNSAGGTSWGHGHHHHHHKSSQKLKDDADSHDKRQSESSDEPDKVVNADSNIENFTQHEFALRKRKPIADGNSGKQEMVAVDGSTTSIEPVNKKELDSFPSSLVFGYLNLFSDGVHNFTDGMALGSAFLLYGSVGGWSRTLFLLAHELPQEIGDFGILVRSGFSVTEALFFNFLSALVALAGTALALIWGQDPGQSSLIEGFTAGGFIYIAVAGVLAEMNNGSTSVKTTAVHVSSLVSGMAVALFISLIE